jgi:hypothetical protein
MASVLWDIVQDTVNYYAASKNFGFGSGVIPTQ